MQIRTDVNIICFKGNDYFVFFHNFLHSVETCFDSKVQNEPSNVFVRDAPSEMYWKYEITASLLTQDVISNLFLYLSRHCLAMHECKKEMNPLSCAN